jgi:hypothetical protein
MYAENIHCFLGIKTCIGFTYTGLLCNTMDYLSNIIIYIVTEQLIEAFVEEEASRLN